MSNFRVVNKWHYAIFYPPQGRDVINGQPFCEIAKLK